MWFFLGLTIISAAAATALVCWQVRELRQGRLTPPPHSLSLSEILERRLDQFSLAVFSFVKFAGQLISFYTLTILHRLLVFFRSLLSRLERKFSRWLEVIRGRRSPP